MYTTDQFEGMVAGTTTIKGHQEDAINTYFARPEGCLLYTSPSPRDGLLSRMPSSA